LSSSIVKRCLQNSQTASAVMAVYLVLGSLAGNARAVEPGVTVTYGGFGAGMVVFDGTIHARKGITCDMCHEARGFSSALFQMKRGDNAITMSRMEKGRSCGACHEVSLSDTRSCEKCHHK